MITNSTDNEIKQVFGVLPNNESDFSAVAPGTEGPKTRQALTAATTNSSSLFSTPRTSLPNTTTQFGVANLRTVKTDSQNVENISSHGFSFAPLNPAGDPKPDTTVFTFSSNSGQKPAGTGSGGFSAPTFGIPSNSTQTTTTPGFGVLATTNPSSGSASAPIQFSFAARNGKPSTGFTFAGAAGDNKHQASTISATPFSLGTPPKPQPAPTSNILLSNPTNQDNSKPFSFGVPNPQQRPIATGSIFGGMDDGKNFNFATGDQKTPASKNSNIFETASNSFATSVSTTALNFIFTPQSTANSMFGSFTTTTSNSNSSVFGGPSASTSPAFGATTTPEGPKTRQALTAATTNSSSLFSAPRTSLPNTTTQFGVANLRTVKTDSQNHENISSHGFSFAPLNPAGDPKPNTTVITFSSNSGQKPAGTGSGGISAPTFGIPSNSTQITTAPGFGVLATTNPSSGSASAPIQFSFAASNGKPSTGFTLAGTAGDNKHQASTISATPFSLGTPPKPQPAPTSNILLSNPTDQDNSKPFSFGVPNPQQKPIATGSIFGGMDDGKNFNFATGDQKAPASKNSNIFETASNSFATSVSTTALNFIFTPQSTANSMFGSFTTTTSNSNSSVFGGPSASKAPAFGATTAPEGPKTRQALTAATTNASSLFSAPRTSLPNTTTQFGVANLRTVKTDSQNHENISSHGFSFAPLNPAGDPKPNTTVCTFSSNSGQKPAGTGSGGFSAPTFGIPSNSTQTTTTPGFGVLATTNPSSGSASAPIQFSFAASNGKPSTGFTFAGPAGDNKHQASTISATPFSLGIPPKPQPAPTSNVLLSNPTDRDNSKPFSFGVPNPQQKPIATGSIFGGMGYGKNFNFAAPASKNSNIFETASNSFTTSASTTALNFIFTPQSTANSIFGSFNTTTSNSNSSVFGGPSASTAPAFGATTAPAPSSSIFGQASNTSSAFGAPKTTVNSVFAPSISESKSSAPLAFGAPTSNTPANMKTFSFGVNNSTNNAGGFSFSAAIADTPNKGGTSEAPAPSAAPSNSFSFRQGQSINNNAVFFGSPVQNSPNAPSVFGSPTKTFSFSAGSTAPPAPSIPFGSVPAEIKTDKIFHFWETPQQPATTSNNSKPFDFGGGPSARSAFTFNTASTAAPLPPAAAANKTFGGSSAQSANQSNKSTAAQFSFIAFKRLNKQVKLVSP